LYVHIYRCREKRERKGLRKENKEKKEREKRKKGRERETEREREKENYERCKNQNVLNSCMMAIVQKQKEDNNDECCNCTERE
jgi:hypothetical protein